MGELELNEEKYQVLWKVNAEATQKHSLGWKMLEHNEIRGFLSFDYYYVDNQIYFRYGYQSLQRMEDYFKVKEGDFETIFFVCEAVLKILERGQEYLLDCGGCLFLPEWIFWNRYEKTLKICFLPGREGDAEKDYTTLVEYLMQHAAHKDEKLVAMIYGLYDKLTSEGFIPEQLLQYLQGFLHQSREVSEKQRKGSGSEKSKEFEECAPVRKKMRRESSVSSAQNIEQSYFLEPFQTSETGRLAKYLLNERDGTSYAVSIGESVVGRKAESDFYIPFSEISRRHALLICEKEGLFVMDTASKNGTYLNGNKISAYVKTSCKEDDVITFADIPYKIRRS